MKNKGVLTVVSGFSGVGKGTLIKNLLSKYDYALSISATSRQPRAGEENGREYFFLTRDEFSDMIKNNGFIEWAEYVGNFYGTPRKYVEEKLELGEDIILEIEPQGAMKVKEQYKDAVLIFIVPPTATDLEKRLIGRGTEEEATIKMRLHRAAEETVYIENYDFIVVNDDLEEATGEVHSIIQAAHFKKENVRDFLNTLITELKEGF